MAIATSSAAGSGEDESYASTRRIAAPGPTERSAEAGLLATRREMRREKEKLRIERAALELFLARGPDEVTVDDIAEAAHISKRTFFRYFPSREDILVENHMRAMRRAVAAFRARPAEETLVTALVNASRTSKAWPSDSREEIEIAQIAQRLLLTRPAIWTRVIAISHEKIVQDFAGAVAFRWEAVGRSAAGAAVMASTIWAISCFVFSEWLRSGGRRNVADDLDAALRTVGEAFTDARTGYREWSGTGA